MYCDCHESSSLYFFTQSSNKYSIQQKISYEFLVAEGADADVYCTCVVRLGEPGGDFVMKLPLLSESLSSALE